METVHAYGNSLEPIRVKVEKNTKGYNWEISVAGDDLDVIFGKLNDAESRLQQKYGQP
jgi:hypothetical protein